MNREQFDHVVRAAGAVLGTNDVLVIGSQAVHGSLRTLFPEALRSMEVDVASFDDTGAAADLIDGTIGELSMFHATHGYYAQGTTELTAVLPDGWKDRLVAYESPATNGVRAHCLEIHDLWISKAVAGREKDGEFCRRLREFRRVDKEELGKRLAAVEGLDPALRQRVHEMIWARSPEGGLRPGRG